MPLCKPSPALLPSEGSDGFVHRLVYFEHRVETCHRQKASDLRPQSSELEPPSLACSALVGSEKSSHPGTTQEWDATEVQDELIAVTLRQQFVERVLENLVGAHVQSAIQDEQSDLVVPTCPRNTDLQPVLHCSPHRRRTTQESGDVAATKTARLGLRTKRLLR